MASRNSALCPRHLGAARFVPSRGGHTDSRENHERRRPQLSRQCCLAAPPPRSPSETPRRPSHLETKSVTLEKTGQQVGTVIQNVLQSNPEYSSLCLLSACLKIKTILFTVSSLWFPLRINTSPPNHLMPWFSMNFKDGWRFIHLTPNKKSSLKELKLSFSAFLFIYLFIYLFIFLIHPIPSGGCQRSESLHGPSCIPSLELLMPHLSWYFHIFLC